MSKGLIYDWYLGESSPVVDITGTQVGYSLQFSPDDDPNNLPPAVPLTDPSVSQVQTAFNSPTLSLGGMTLPALTVIQNIPAELAAFWSKVVVPQIQSSIASQLSQLGQLSSSIGAGKFTSSNLSLPQGRVRARAVPGGPLLIDYWVGGLSFDVSAQKKLQAGKVSIGSVTISFHISFDAELLVYASIQWPVVQTIPVIALFNASITPTGSTAFLLGAAQSAWDYEHLNDSANYGFQLASPFDLSQYENQIDNAALPSVPVTVLDSIGSAFAAIGSVALSFGFGASPPAPSAVPVPQCVAIVDPAAATPLVLQLTKPVDLPPVAFDPLTQAGPGPQNWILGGATISVSQTQVVAAEQYTVTGTGFPQSNFVGVGWSNSCSGTLVNSVVEWQINGQSQTPANVPQPSALFFVPPTVPNAGDVFQFRVRNQDLLSTTGPTNLVPVQAVGNVQLALTYLHWQSEGPRVPGHKSTVTQPVGSIPVPPGGTFLLVPITIPDDALPGVAILSAQLLGQEIASIQLEVVTIVQTKLTVINPSNNLVVIPPAGTQGYVTTVHGEGFVAPTPGGPALHVTLYIDHVSGAGLGTAPVQGDGTFTMGFSWPENVLAGSHSVIAVEKVSQQNIEGTLIVDLHQIPQ